MEKILVMVLAVLSTDWLLVLACRDLSQSKFWQPSSCVNMQTGYLPSIQKDSSTHMHGLAVYVKEGLPFAQDLSLQNSADTYLCFWLALLHSVSYVSFLHWSPSSSLCNVFDSVSSDIDKILLINPSANVLVFEDFNIHHKDWLTYSGGTDRPGEVRYNFSISNDLTQMVNFSTQIPDWFSQSCSFGFDSSDASICSTMAFPQLGSYDHVVVTIFIDFPLNSQHDASFPCIAYDYTCADWDSLCDHLRDVPWKDIFRLSVLLLLVNFLSGFKLELMYIPFIVSINSSLIHLHAFQLLVLLP